MLESRGSVVMAFWIPYCFDPSLVSSRGPQRSRGCAKVGLHMTAVARLTESGAKHENGWCDMPGGCLDMDRALLGLADTKGINSVMTKKMCATARDLQVSQMSYAKWSMETIPLAMLQVQPSATARERQWRRDHSTYGSLQPTRIHVLY